MILVITNKEDVHPTPVIEILNKRNIPVFRLNTESLLTDYDFCWWNDCNKSRFYITNRQTGLQLDEEKLTTVWDRRPERPSGLLIKGTESINKHNLEEATGFLHFLRSYIAGMQSIGSIKFDGLASSKMEQIRIAQIVGLKVPNTCFSNRQEDVVKMAIQYDELILKPIESNSIFDADEENDYVFYTQKVTSETIMSAPKEAFTQTVTFVQNYIPKAFELRVTVVAGKVFGCKIESQHLPEDSGKVDWRQGIEKGLRYAPYPLPNDISQKCLRFLRLMKLNFGAFDFIITPSGEYVFLECNPNGQWLWIELETGLKISEAIADALETGEGLIAY
jgi:glutathione synthase/RimK-type ligase-like ATP-grasp enzyme